MSATALYRYFPDRRSLCEAVSDEVTKEIVEADQGGAWTTRLRSLIVAQHRILTDVPGIAQFLFENQDSVPAMRWTNAILRVLLDAGFTRSGADRAPHRADLLCGPGILRWPGGSTERNCAGQFATVSVATQ